MAHNIRVKQLMKGLNVSLEDLQFYMSDDSIKLTSRVRILVGGERVINERTMSKKDMLDLINILDREVDARDKIVKDLNDELLTAQNRVYEIEQELMVRGYDVSTEEEVWEGDRDSIAGPWSLDWEDEKEFRGIESEISLGKLEKKMERFAAERKKKEE
jgi:hypothetical protein